MLKRLKFQGRLTILTAEDVPPYDRPQLSKGFMSGDAEPESCLLRPRDFYEELDIDVLKNHRVVRLDVENLMLMGVYTTPSGRISPLVEPRLREMGAWLEVNGEAIYGTRMHSEYRDGNIWYARKGGTVYAIHTQPSDSTTQPVKPPREVVVRNVDPVPGSEVHLLGVAKPLEWKKREDAVVITVPDEVIASPPCEHAYAFRIETLGS